MRLLRVALPVALLAWFVAGSVGVSNAASTACTASAPGVTVDNTTGWSQWGSWGYPGQKLTYAVHVINYDVGCSSSTFSVNVASPAGFSVSMPTSTISLNAGASGYLWAYVTSPSGAADGNYPLAVTAQRSGSASSPFVTYYKVYSSDTSAPTLYWPNPADGQSITGKSYNMIVSTGDDHMVQKVEIYIDGALKSTTNCDGVSYTCQGYYKWSMRGVKGQHTATFKAYDWMGNVGVLTSRFTVN